MLVAVVVSTMGVLGARGPSEEPIGARQRQGEAYYSYRVLVVVGLWHIGAPPFVEVSLIGLPGLGQPFDL